MKIGIVDTMFSRVDMGSIAIDELKKYREQYYDGYDIEHERRTVPGIKDLAVVCKQMLDEDCDIVIALGMVGGAPIDTQCAHEASLGIQMAKMLTNKQIIEVFVHENEAWSWTEFKQITENRVRKHMRNAMDIILNPEKLVRNAGKGVRQGKEDEGPININEGNENSESLDVGIVVAKFHKNIVDEMLSVSKEILNSHHIKFSVFEAPGSFDTPLLVKKLLMDKTIRGIIVLGAIEKGETNHGNVIGQSTVKTLQELSLQFNKPVTLGIIGPRATEEQIRVRTKKHAKQATEALIDLVKTLKSVK